MLKIQFFYAAGEANLKQDTITPASYSQKVLRLILLFALIKCFLAFSLELGNDEAYYWLYSQYPQWNYFDHPPMIAYWIRIFTCNLALEQYEGFVRLGSVVGCAIASWLLYSAVSEIHSQRAGWFAAVLYNVSFYSGITAGLYAMPDSPQMVFWTLGMWCIARLVKDDNNWKLWMFTGIVFGLCIMSKIHGAFLWIGLGGFILFQKPSWLKKPQLYLALVITALIISPIAIWNIRYDFATFRFHSNRLDAGEAVLNWQYFFREAGSQLGFNNPVNVILIVAAVVAFLRRKMTYNSALAIYLFTSLPLIISLLLISLVKNVTLPHWSGPAYVGLIPLAAIWLAERSTRSFPTILKWAMAIFAIIYLGYAGATKFFPGTWGSQSADDRGRGDISLDMYGWKAASTAFQFMYRKDVAAGVMPANAAMVTTHWWGAHVEYYFAHPLGLKMIGMGKPQYMNEYVWTNQPAMKEVNLDSVYCIVSTDAKYAPPTDFYRQKELAAIIPVFRSGKPAHDFLVYRLKGLIKTVPVPK